MRFAAPLALVFASAALAQRITTTLPWANGDTLVVSIQTDADGEAIDTVTLQTVTNGVAGAAAATTAGTTARTTARTTAGTTAKTTTQQQKVVGQETTAAPMRTTTYGYDPGDGGEWATATWTASITAAPTVATVIPPEGTIQNYDQYQSSVNKIVFASAQNAENALVSGSTGAANRRAIGPSGGVMMGWAGLAIGAVGAGVGVLGL